MMPRGIRINVSQCQIAIGFAEKGVLFMDVEKYHCWEISKKENAGEKADWMTNYL